MNEQPAPNGPAQEPEALTDAERMELDEDIQNFIANWCATDDATRLQILTATVKQPVQLIHYVTGKSVLTDSALVVLFVRDPSGRVVKPSRASLPRDLTVAWHETFVGEDARSILIRWAMAESARTPFFMSLITPVQTSVVNREQIIACLGARFPFDTEN